MELDLPALDIVEDIEDIMNDDEDKGEPLTTHHERGLGGSPSSEIISPEEFEVQEEIEKEKKQPFVKKAPKKKKDLSEKQKVHLEKIRGMALEKRKAKAAAKKAAVDKATAEVAEQHKPKYYKPKPKKTPEEKQLEKEAKRKYKKTTMEVEEENIQSEIEETTPEDFVPTHKAEVREKEKEKIFNQQDSFNHFMGNMENYLKMRDAYENKKIKGEPRSEPPVTRSKTKQKVKTQSVPAILKPIQESPFSNYFG